MADMSLEWVEDQLGDIAPKRFTDEFAEEVARARWERESSETARDRKLRQLKAQAEAAGIKTKAAQEDWAKLHPEYHEACDRHDQACAVYDKMVYLYRNAEALRSLYISMNANKRSSHGL